MEDHRPTTGVFLSLLSQGVLCTMSHLAGDKYYLIFLIKLKKEIESKLFRILIVVWMENV